MHKILLKLKSKQHALPIVAGLCISFCLLYFLFYVNNAHGRSDDAFKQIKPELQAVGFENPEVFTAGACYLDKDARLLLASTCHSSELKDDLTITPDTEKTYAANIRQLKEKLVKDGWGVDRESNLDGDDYWNILENMATDMSKGKSDHDITFSKKTGRTCLKIQFITHTAPDSVTMYFSAEQHRRLGIL